jgi:hypothetical protein
MSNFLIPAAQSEATPLDASSVTSNPPIVSSPQGLKRLDLSAIKADRSLSLHKVLKPIVTYDSIMAHITAIDLDHVYMSDEASAALSRSYLTPEFVIDKFGNYYKKNIVAVVTSGKLKGMKYINSAANEYVHATDDGIDIVVSGKCVEQDGKKTRQIHITCRLAKDDAAPETAIEMA